MQVNGGARPTQPKLAVPGHAKLVICDYAIERTFGWLTRCRRLSKDYEVWSATSEAWIYAAMVQLMLGRLARNPAVYL